jgi:3-hydroxybutyryl-CoA dehydrogenase
MSVEYKSDGISRSFPEGFEAEGDGIVFAGDEVSALLADSMGSDRPFIAIELGNECLSEHIGLEADGQNENIVGFARFRLGDDDPTALVELVRQPWTNSDAVDQARSAFESTGLTVAVCNDRPGRIVNRLLRPYFNAVLRRYDEGLASADDLDQTMRMGLGYPEGPLALLGRSGLEHHYDVSQALHTALGDPDFAPARRAQVAKALAKR